MAADEPSASVTDIFGRRRQQEVEELAEQIGVALGHFRAGAMSLAALEDRILKLDALRAAVRGLGPLAEEAMDAAMTLVRGDPLAATFPRGDPVPERPTPRQVLYLAVLARPQSAYDIECGRHPRRPCESRTKEGHLCGSSALAFIDRPRCVAHSTEEERALNRQKLEHYRANHPMRGLSGDGVPPHFPS